MDKETEQEIIRQIFEGCAKANEYARKRGSWVGKPFNIQIQEVRAKANRKYAKIMRHRK